jgi:HECT-domain (ubiquitin-transferase)
VAQELLRHPAINVCATDGRGWTPLLYALCEEHIACVNIIFNISPDAALQQLQLLGKCISKHSLDDDEQFQDVMEALATIPEFHALLNATVRANLHLLDARSSDLHFLMEYTCLLDLRNKLAVAKLQCKYWAYTSAVMRQADATPYEHFPILGGSSTYVDGSSWSNQAASVVKVARSDAWRSLMTVMARKGKKEAIDLMRSSIIIQFDGPYEVGFGRGVEREAIQLISRGLVVPEDGSIVKADDSHRAHHDHRNHHSGNTGGHSCAIFVQQESQALPCIPLPILAPSHHTKAKVLCNLDDDGYEDEYDDGYSNEYGDTDTDIGVDSYGGGDDDEDSRTIEQYLFVLLGQFVGHLLLRRLAKISFRQKPVTSEKASSGSVGDDSTISDSILTLNLPQCFWKLVLGTPIDLSDVASMDVEKYKSMLFVDECSAELLEDLCLTFSVAETSLVDGTTSVTELKRGGARIDVDEDNKDEYLERMVYHCINKRMDKQAALMREGLTMVVPPTCLSLFSASELSLLVSGSAAIDVVDWRQHTVYNNGYTNDDCVIGWFWTLVLDLSEHEKALLLLFCTGCSRLPSSGGFSALRPSFAIAKKPYDAHTSLPTAATCFNLLRLPMYPDEHTLRKNVMTAIVYGSQGFSFS